MDAISGVSGAGSQYQAQLRKAEEKQKEGPDIYEMMRDAKEKAEAAREKFQSLKASPATETRPLKPTRVLPGRSVRRRSTRRLATRGGRLPV